MGGMNKNKDYFKKKKQQKPKKDSNNKGFDARGG
jgi:hypothetical protein